MILLNTLEARIPTNKTIILMTDWAVRRFSFILSAFCRNRNLIFWYSYKTPNQKQIESEKSYWNLEMYDNIELEFIPAQRWSHLLSYIILVATTKCL